MDMMITGHRPNKLYGYNLNVYQWQLLKNKIARILLDKRCGTFYTGMALGVDTIAAMAALDLKQSGTNIKVVACIPFVGQENRWPLQSREQYRKLLSLCDEQVVVCTGGYQPYKMHLRNKYMVDRSDIVIAVWDGSDGGTGKCVTYAMEQGKEVINLL